MEQWAACTTSVSLPTTALAAAEGGRAEKDNASLFVGGRNDDSSLMDINIRKQSRISVSFVC